MSRRDESPRAPEAVSLGGRHGRDRRGYVVELFGLPGAGKTRLADELLRAAAHIGMRMERPVARIGPSRSPVVRIGWKLGRAVGECVARPMGSISAARVVLGSQDSGLVAGVPRWVHWLVAQRSVTSARRMGGTHLFDEGLLQALWSIGLRGDVGPVLERVAASAEHRSLPDLVVVVRVAPDVAESRLASRISSHSRVQEIEDQEARRTELRRGVHLVETLLAWWAGVPGAGPVLEVDNTAPNVETTAARAMAEIARRAARVDHVARPRRSP